MLRAIEVVARQHEEGDILNEEQAAELLGMKVASLRNRRYDGTIPEQCYQKTVTGSFVYFKNKLLIRN
jgi:hypothetical protein